jgi:hypothetical protein
MATQPVPVSAALPPVRTKFQDDRGAGGISWPWIKWFQLVEIGRKSVTQFLTGTNADRITTQANQFPSGSIFYVTDRTVYYVTNNGQWQYLCGYMQTDQAHLPTDLGANDKGFLVSVTDFQHVLYWTGAAWIWGPGESGSGYIVPFVNPPNPPDGWQACDGSTDIPQLLFDGSLDFVTVPNTAGSFFRQ